MTTRWKSFATVYPSIEVTGKILVWQDVHSPQLDNTRNVLVWLPPDYDASDKRYPVVYVHDAQNIFADELSFAGEWGFDETMTELAAEGLPAIIVGVENTGDGRRTEYSPYDWEHGPAQADAYLAFLLDTVKPIIDADFRVETDPANTGILGSSMGGLISMYGALATEAFGMCGAFSPYFMPGGDDFYDFVAGYDMQDIRLYMDVGTREAYNMGVGPEQQQPFSEWYLAGVRRMDDLLRSKGYHAENYLYVEDEGAVHVEADWARRLPAAMRFLLSK